jgi:malonyl-CoA decarboxylase
LKSIWLDKVIDSVADRGRDMLRLRANNKGPSSTERLCRALLSEKGEASGTALARELVIHYEAMKSEERLAFFELLEAGFGPDKKAIDRAAEAFRAAPETDNYLELSKAVEPPRLKLFRRINIAPNGISAIVGMRADLLELLPQHPGLRAVDADLKRLLSAWFNRGFLELHRIDWRTSATILEKLINYESVHEIQSWADLRRRLAADRRCFAFFHPALPEEPLIFVEAALVRGMSATIAPLLDENSPILAPDDADNVIFYSINNCLRGLRGVSFGNFLIKQVATELGREFPAIRKFCTLSPMPSFNRALRDPDLFSEARLKSVLGEDEKRICAAAGEDAIAAALQKLLADALRHSKILTRPLTRLGLAYLVCARRGERLYDSVAYFHLSNGAQLERVNAFANLSAPGMKQSSGLMVNYRYSPEDFEKNHEAFVHRRKIALSKRLQKTVKGIQDAW